MNYFENYNTPEERKVRYRQLAKLHHPDVGGQHIVMQEINKQYESLGASKVVGLNPGDLKDYYSQFEEAEPTGTMEDLERSKKDINVIKSDFSEGYQRSPGFKFRRKF